MLAADEKGNCCFDELPEGLNGVSAQLYSMDGKPLKNAARSRKHGFA